MLMVVGLLVKDLCSSDATFSHKIHIYWTSATGGSYTISSFDVGDICVEKLLRNGDLDDPLWRFFVSDDCLGETYGYQKVLHRPRNLIRRDSQGPRRFL